jgi:anti-sigma-K factor RskA
MNARPPDGSDEPEAVDQIMLAVLSNRGRDATVLSADQERLLDDWVADRLAPGDAERAEALVRQNTLAAERVLERRLQSAASESPPVPQHLTARILKAGAPPKASTIGAWWRSLGRWQWTGIAGAAALASILVVAGMPMLQQILSGGGPLQVAMVTINDRSPLFETSDIRMRGTTPQQGDPSEQRFRDIQVPTAILRSLLAKAGAPSGGVAPEIEPYLPKSTNANDHSTRVIIDAALKEKLEANDGLPQMTVRLYDLKDPRTANIREITGPLPNNQRLYLLTVKP